MNRPRLLDLCSCTGLAADGYATRFDVYAVDNDPAALRHNPHPQYCGDVLDVLRALLAGDRLPFLHRDGSVEWLALSDFALVHVSPPCQAHSATRKLADAQGKGQGRAVDLLTPVMLLLDDPAGFPVPWIVENVERSPLRKHPRHVRLCGSSFGLKVQRHRLFAYSPGVTLTGPPCDHAGAFDRDLVTGKPRPWGVYYAMGDSIPSGGRTVSTLADGHAVMGITERTVPWRYLCEGLPPAFTAHLADQLVDQLGLAA